MPQPANKRLVTEAALPEAVRDVIEASFVAGSGVTITHDGEADTITIAAIGGGTGLSLEEVQDAVAAMLVEGDGLSAVYDDGAGTYTITNTVTDTNTTDPEVVRDTIAAALVAGAGVSITVDDGGDIITIETTDEALDAALDLPAYAGRRTNPYLPLLNGYNWKASNTRKLRAGIAKAMAGTARANYLFIGDSATEGKVDASAWDKLNAWPIVMRELLGIGHGVPSGGDGLIKLGTTSGDPRVVLGGSWSPTGVYASVSASGQSITITLTQPSTTFDVWYSGTSGSFTISMDGASSGPGYLEVTPPGSSTWVKATVTGSLGMHTVVITTTSATLTAIVNVNAYGASGLVCHNAATSGSSIEDWVNFLSWFQGTGSIELTQPKASQDAVFLGAGGNDWLDGRTLDQMETDMRALINRWLATNLNLVLFIPNQAVASSVPNSVWDEWAGRCYDFADEFDIPLIDFHGRLGSNATIIANGLTVDNTHLTAAGARDLGRQAASLLGS